MNSWAMLMSSLAGPIAYNVRRPRNEFWAILMSSLAGLTKDLVHEKQGQTRFLKCRKASQYLFFA